MRENNTLSMNVGQIGKEPSSERMVVGTDRKSGRKAFRLGFLRWKAAVHQDADLDSKTPEGVLDLTRIEVVVASVAAETGIDDDSSG